MIAAAKSACLFQRQNVGRLLDNAEQFFRARVVSADFTKIRCREETALHTGMDPGPRLGDGASDALGLLIARLHHPKRDAFGRPRPDAGHLAQLDDQLAQGGGIFGSFQSQTSGSATGAGSPTTIR